MEDDRRFDLEFKYAWDWFSYHAQQRLTAFNFFLILMGAVVVSYTQAVNHDLQAFGVALGGLGAFVAVAFWAMEVRNEELVYCGRTALDVLEKKLEVAIRSDDEQRSHLAEAMRGSVEARIYRHLNPRELAHRTWLRRVIAVMGVLSLLAACWAALDFPGAAKESDQMDVCHESKTSPCWALRSSSYGTPTRR